MRQSILIAIPLLMLGLIHGCSLAPSTEDTYYRLPESTVAQSQPAATEQPLLIVLPVSMSSFMANQGLVYQTSPTTLIQAQHNLWGGDITQQLTHRIAQDLRAKQQHYWVSEFTSLLDTTQAVHLQVKIDAFYGQYTGNTLVQGEWVLLNKDDSIRKLKTFQYQTPIQSANYNGQVLALSKGLAQLTAQIAKSLP